MCRRCSWGQPCQARDFYFYGRTKVALRKVNVTIPEFQNYCTCSCTTVRFWFVADVSIWIAVACLTFMLALELFALALAKIRLEIALK